ncbi:MAG: hypothetical protein LRZ97_00540 [Candidatus Pacebacteria bacterium]|nr:hypothetical protein [Candidatus Paceibacterota bacterium]
MSNNKKKGTCFICNNDWYWCQECGAAGCATESCNMQRQVEMTGMFTLGGLKCRVCGSK